MPAAIRVAELGGLLSRAVTRAVRSALEGLTSDPIAQVAQKTGIENLICVPRIPEPGFTNLCEMGVSAEPACGGWIDDFFMGFASIAQ